MARAGVKRMKEEERAARAIQAAARGRAARKRVSNLRRERQEALAVIEAGEEEEGMRRLAAAELALLQEAQQVEGLELIRDADGEEVRQVAGERLQGLEQDESQLAEQVRDMPLARVEEELRHRLAEFDDSETLRETDTETDTDLDRGTAAGAARAELRGLQQLQQELHEEASSSEDAALADTLSAIEGADREHVVAVAGERLHHIAESEPTQAGVVRDMPLERAQAELSEKLRLLEEDELSESDVTDKSLLEGASNETADSSN